MQSYIFYGMLILLLLAMIIMPYFTQRKRNQEYVKMLESLKVGDLVKTAGGIIGKITKIQDKGEIKTVIVESGAKNNKSTLEFDISMIYCILNSSKAEKPEAAEESAEENAEEVVAEEKPQQKKAPAKKSAKKPAKTKKEN